MASNLNHLSKMKQLATVISCALLCAYGVYISDARESKSQNTISAAEVPLQKLLNPVRIEVHDTIHTGDTIRDTVPKVITKTRYRIKREPCATCETVSVTRPTLRGDRKEAPLDTITKMGENIKLIKVWVPLYFPKNDSITLPGVVQSPV